MLVLRLLALLNLSTAAFAAPYVVTSYIELHTTTIPGYTYYTGTDNIPALTVTAKVSTQTKSIIPTISSASGVSTFTVSDKHYTNLLVVEIVVPSGVGITYTGQAYNSSSTSALTAFFVPVTYEPFSTCTGQAWKYLTTVPLIIPTPVQSVLTPLASGTTTSSLSTTRGTSAYLEYYTVVSVLVNPTDVPLEQYSSVSKAWQPAGVTLCVDPTETSRVGGTGTGTVGGASSTATVSSSGIQCGKANPRCEGCTRYIEYCIGTGCGGKGGTYLECEDGKKYWITGGPGGGVNMLAVEIAVPIVVALLLASCCACCARKRR